MSGWWRRNVIALALTPVVGGATFLVVGGPLRDVWEAGDEDTREIAHDETVRWDPEATLTLVDLDAPDPVRREDGDVFDVPLGTRVWRARFDATATSMEAGVGCRVRLLDERGRWFSPALVDLSPLGGDGLCSPPLEADPAGYRLTFWFLLPDDAEPASLTVGSIASGAEFSMDVSSG